MARPYYTEVEGGIWHLTSRGIARRTVFEDDWDCSRFLDELEDTTTRHAWRCLSYCLMGNHFHLIVQTPKPTLASGMRDLKRGYVTSSNARRGLDGSRFKAGFGRQLIQDGAYLMAAAVYVAQNPVRAGLVDHPHEWRWSSFADTAGDAPTFVDPELLLAEFDADPGVARKAFAHLAGAVNGAPAFDPTLPIVGDGDFVRLHAPRERPGRAVVKRAWEQARPTLGSLAASHEEDAFLRLARLEYRYTLGAIAKQLGCSERTVQRRLACRVPGPDG